MKPSFLHPSLLQVALVAAVLACAGIASMAHAATPAEQLPGPHSLPGVGTLSILLGLPVVPEAMVDSRASCAACHAGAAKGDFDDDIRILE